jgi:hypothetical protein
MHTSISASPTGDLDATTVARFRKGDHWLDYDRSQAGLPELVGCDGCDLGIAQREVDDYSDDCGPSYRAAEGCSSEVATVTLPGGTTYRSRSFFCPACTAPEAA